MVVGGETGETGASSKVKKDKTTKDAAGNKWYLSACTDFPLLPTYYIP